MTSQGDFGKDAKDLGGLSAVDLRDVDLSAADLYRAFGPF